MNAEKNELEYTLIDFESYYVLVRNDRIDLKDFKMLFSEFIHKWNKQKNMHFGRFVSGSLSIHTEFDILDITHKVENLWIDGSKLKVKLRLIGEDYRVSKIKELLDEGFQIAAFIDTYDKRINLTPIENVSGNNVINIEEMFDKMFNYTPDGIMKILTRQYATLNMTYGRI